MGGLCKQLETLKVGIGHLRARWMPFLLGRDGVISLENLREMVFPATLEVDSWMPGVDKLFGRAPRLEKAMLLDWRGSHQHLDRESRLISLDWSNLSQDITPIRAFASSPCSSLWHIRTDTVFIALWYPRMPKRIRRI